MKRILTWLSICILIGAPVVAGVWGVILTSSVFQTPRPIWMVGGATAVVALVGIVARRPWKRIGLYSLAPLLVVGAVVLACPPLDRWFIPAVAALIAAWTAYAAVSAWSTRHTAH